MVVDNVKGKFKVWIKAGSSVDEFVGWDDVRKAYVVRIKCRAIDGKANLALLKFMKKKFGCDFRIVSGFTSKSKILERV